MKAPKKCFLMVQAVLMCAGFSLPAYCVEQKSVVLDEGITTTDYVDGSGFEVKGGGAIFTYDYRTKLLTMDSADVHIRVVFPSNAERD